MLSVKTTANNKKNSPFEIIEEPTLENKTYNKECYYNRNCNKQPVIQI